MAVRSVVRDSTAYAPSKELLIGERNLLNTLIDALPETGLRQDYHRRYIVCNLAHAKALGVK